MANFPSNLRQKLEQRTQANAQRTLLITDGLVDFSSNDYLGFAKIGAIEAHAQKILGESPFLNGGTGSRLLTGNHPLYDKLEQYLSSHYQVPSALVFNSGYDANVGFFSAVPQRGDIVFYDELVHASIRDGIKMGNAQSVKFKHNDVEDLQKKLVRLKRTSDFVEIYVVTETVFSMDGDSPNLKQLAELCKQNSAHFVVDEAHAIGGYKKGLVFELGLKDQLFAQIITFSKALGGHGAAILGGTELKDYLVNFARSFIYSTALPPHSIATTMASYYYLDSQAGNNAITSLQQNIAHFISVLKEKGLNDYFMPSTSPIQLMIKPGNEKVKKVARFLNKEGFDVRAILSPTVPKGNERIRFSIHSFNTFEQLDNLLQLVKEINNG
ncbi:MAG: 8-amino-7-oxononanoate synthase [Croceitalea sp.]|nr:8-amino-7-oxononanoate synthase [Croceitalea sp.]